MTKYRWNIVLMLWLLGFGIGNQVSYIVVISVVLVKNMTNKKQIFGSAVSILENQLI